MDGQSSLIELAIPGDEAMWAARIEHICCVLEGRLKPQSILWARSQKDGARDQAMDSREKFLAKVGRTSSRWLSLHNGGRSTDTRVEVGGRFDDLDRRVYSVVATIPTTPDGVIESIVEDLADQSGALNGRYSPEETRIWLFGGQFMNDWDVALENGADESVQSLPKLRWTPHGAKLQSDAQPELLGWLNYWSKSACEWLKFPNDQRDQDVLRISKPIAGGWLVKITPDPLDLRNPAHVKMLASFYDRFPGLGVRAR